MLFEEGWGRGGGGGRWKERGSLVFLRGERLKVGGVFATDGEGTKASFSLWVLLGERGAGFGGRKGAAPWCFCVGGERLKVSALV